jgi:hypothetical protein
MKNIYLLIAAFTIIGSACAQPPTMPNVFGEKKIIQGMNVLLRPAPGNTYLFDILPSGKEPIPPMLNNPVTLLPEGFETKEQAFKAAEWMISEYKKTGHFQPFIPSHVARELNIPTHPSLKRQNR